MTVSIQVSVNGNYKVPVTVKYDDKEPFADVISGRGLIAPFVKDIPAYHGKVTTVTVGPEERDEPV